jgi:hypothetical protein
MTYGVYKEPDGSGFYAGVEDQGRIVWRSLTTRDEERAERWKQQAWCHGVNAHHLDCTDCKVGG